ncbi:MULTISPECIES: hypothetical protein [unclassified Actinoplanes]|uniref:hypothetical protein n=1 Tax=unclassified Actinoplanes TaxID=2626549 RepID=UPI0005B984C1|nr:MULTISPECIES: hypothetical protein [unclassified Actinoplanes]
MMPTPGTLRLVATLGAVPGLRPTVDSAIPPMVTWEDGPSGRAAAQALVASGYTVSEQFWGGGVVDVPTSNHAYSSASCGP